MDNQLANLKEKIGSRNARIAVIGLGYVGLPVACEFARAGFDVLGVDIVEDRVALINQGRSPIEGDEPGLAELVRSVISQGQLRASVDYQDLSDRDVVLIDVETPVDHHHQPRYHALKKALDDLGPVLKAGALVIVESTIAPLTMQDVVLPLLQKSSGKKLNQGFFLGNCPERVMPGKLLHNLRHVSRVVGGMTPATADTMAALYSWVVDADLDATDCITAELVKTAENAYRDVNIAFANEVALIAEAVGGDVWKVRELINKSPGRNMLLPGAGVGGHCIPKDPWLLVANLDQRYLPKLIPAAREINEGMPLHLVQLTLTGLQKAGRGIKDAKIAVLGYAYLEDSDDTRNSPSEMLVATLQDLGAEVVVHDPFVSEYQGDPYQVVSGCQAVVMMVKHSAYRSLDLTTLKESMIYPLIIDGRRVFDREQVLQKGLEYIGIGQSTAASGSMSE